MGTDRAAASNEVWIADHTAAISFSGTSSAFPRVSMVRWTSAWVRGSKASTVTPKSASLSAPRADVPIKTKSGLAATTLSILGSTPPPIRGSLLTLSGQLEYLSTPTSFLHCPKAHTVSVSDGNKLTMRCGGLAITTSICRSSFTTIACAVVKTNPMAETKNHRSFD